jgi:hypothetical protein
VTDAERRLRARRDALQARRDALALRVARTDAALTVTHRRLIGLVQARLSGQTNAPGASHGPGAFLKRNQNEYTTREGGR